MTSIVGVLGPVALVASLRGHTISPIGIVVLVLVLPQAALLVLRRSARLDGFLFVLVALHVVVSTLLAPGVVWGLCVVAILAVIPCALVLSLLRREVENNYRSGARDRSGMPVDVARILRSRRVVNRRFAVAALGLVFPLGAMAIAFFVACPHLSLALFTLEPSLRGLAAPDFGERPIKNDDSIIARFELAGESAPVLPLRLRVETFDTWDGKTWLRPAGSIAKSTVVSTNASVILQRPRRHGDRAFLLDVDDGLDILPLPDDAVAIDAPSLHATHFRVWLGERSVRSASRAATLLAVPNTFSPRGRELAHRWADGETTAEDKARAIETHLKTELIYDLDPLSRTAPNPLDHFLFESRRGHCLYFATSMIMMLREVGVPSRPVSGFAGATYNPYGRYYAVRGRDAHAWVEADLGGTWRTFDPTPSSPRPRIDAGAVATTRAMTDALERRWSLDVVHFDPRGTSGLHHRLRNTAIQAWPGLASVLFLSVVTWTLRRGLRRRTASSERSKSASAAVDLYAALERALTQSRLRRDPSIPPERFSHDLTTSGHPLAAEVTSLTQVYLETRFGGRTLTTEERARYHARIDALPAPARA